MYTEINIDVKTLLDRPVWQLTGREFCALTQFANAGTAATRTEGQRPTRIVGVHALANYLNCCDSTVFALRRYGVLDEAIIPAPGKKLVFDGDKARALVEEYLNNRRKNNG